MYPPSSDGNFWTDGIKLLKSVELIHEFWPIRMRLTEFDRFLFYKFPTLLFYIKVHKYVWNKGWMKAANCSNYYGAIRMNRGGAFQPTLEYKVISVKKGVARGLNHCMDLKSQNNIAHFLSVSLPVALQNLYVDGKKP